MYEYLVSVTCGECFVEWEMTIVSINPDKKTLTFAATNPLTGMGGLESVMRLPCGHYTDLEGVPVEKVV